MMRCLWLTYRKRVMTKKILVLGFAAIGMSCRWLRGPA